MVRLVRRLVVPVVLAVVLCAVVYLGFQRGRLVGGVALLGALVFLAVVFLVLPRLAHNAFERGDHARAELAYRIIRIFASSPQSCGALDVSLAGCRLARGDFPGALAELDRVAPADLPTAARAAWHNNRAYALARGELGARGGPGGSADGGSEHSGALIDGLAAIDEAIRLRPDIAGFRHTRGVVLLALGRLDDAIAELDEVWHQVSPGDAPALLEAERCYDLGVAWARKGEVDYARDYFQRSLHVAPASTFAPRVMKARSQLPPSPPPPVA